MSPMSEENPYVVELSKRIRYVRKKLDRIEKLQSAPDASKEDLDEDQSKLLASKSDFESRLAELQVLRSKFESCENATSARENLQEAKYVVASGVALAAPASPPNHPEPENPLDYLTGDLQELVISGAVTLEEALRIFPEAGCSQDTRVKADTEEEEAEEKKKEPSANPAVLGAVPTFAASGSSQQAPETVPEMRAQDALRRLISLLAVTQHWEGGCMAGAAGAPPPAPLPEAVSLLGHAVLGHGHAAAATAAAANTAAAAAAPQPGEFQARVDRAARDALLFVLGDPDRPLVAGHTVGELRAAVDALLDVMRTGNTTGAAAGAPVPLAPRQPTTLPSPPAVAAAPTVVAPIAPAAPSAPEPNPAARPDEPKKVERAARAKAPPSSKPPKAVVDCPICGVKCGDLGKHTALKHPSTVAATATEPELMVRPPPPALAGEAAAAAADVDDEEITFGAVYEDEVEDTEEEEGGSAQGEDEADSPPGPIDGPMLHFDWAGGYEGWASAAAVEGPPALPPTKRNDGVERRGGVWDPRGGGSAAAALPQAGRHPQASAPAGGPAISKPLASAGGGGAVKDKAPARRTKKRSAADSESAAAAATTTTTRRPTGDRFLGKGQAVSAGGKPKASSAEVRPVFDKASAGGAEVAPGGLKVPAAQGKESRQATYVPPPPPPKKKSPKPNPPNSSGPAKEASQRARPKRTTEAVQEKNDRHTSSEVGAGAKAGKGKGSKGGKGGKKGVTAATTTKTSIGGGGNPTPFVHPAPSSKPIATPPSKPKSEVGAQAEHGKGRGTGKGGARGSNGKSGPNGEMPGKGQSRSGGKGTKPLRTGARLPPPAPPAANLTWDSACTPVTSA